MVVSNIFYFHLYLGKWSKLTNIFQMGWNYQLVMAYVGLVIPTGEGEVASGLGSWHFPQKMARDLKISWRFWGAVKQKVVNGKHVATARFPTVMVLCKLFGGSMYTLKRHFFFGGKMIIYLPFDEFQIMIMGVLKKTTSYNHFAPW